MSQNKVYIYADTVDGLSELISAGLSLNSDISVIAINSELANLALKLGAIEVFEINGECEIVENYSETIASIVKEGVLLTPSNRSGKAIASLLGEKLKAGVCTEVTSLSKSESGLICQKMVYGGVGVSKQIIKTDLAIVSIASRSFLPAIENPKDGKIKSINFIKPKHLIKLIKNTPKKASSVELSKAKRIIAIGRGIAEEKDIDMIRDLCSKVDAKLGCTRPIAESEKWLDRDRYIGISSVMANPKVYIGIGISGQIQHMVGIKDAEKIIAINKDENAPIFEYADYGIVGDLYKILPRLIKAFG